MQLTQTEVDRLAESAARARTARPRHGVHARGALQAPALPGPDRGRRARRGARPAGRQLRPDAAGRGARRPGDRDRPARRPPGCRDPATRVEDDVHERLRHAGRGGLRRLLGPGRLQRPAARRAADPAAQDRELHALGRAPADRRAGPLRARRRRAPAAAGRRHPGRLVDARPARVGARGVRRDRRGHRRARPRRGLAPAPARQRARPARARRRAGDRGLARAHRGAGGPAGRRDPARPDRRRAGQAPAVRPPRPGADPRHHARRRAPPRRRRDRGDRARPRRPSRSSSRRATARRPRPSTARRSRSPSRSCARARRRPGWPTS